MIIKDLLIIPSWRLLQQPLTRLKSKLYRTELPHHAEIQYAGDIPRLLGKEHTFVLGQYYPHYFEVSFPERCSYPSCHGAPRPTFITPRQLQQTLDRVDAVLISVLGQPAAIAAATAGAHARNLPVAILDIPDYDTLYGDPQAAERLTLHFQHGRDFDLYFKKDLPLGLKTDVIHPFGPIPVRPESYHFRPLSKETPVFYSGRRREDQSSPERAQLVALIEKKIPGAAVIAHDTRQTFMTAQEYWDHLARARVAFSPSGRCWDSFRHCEVGLAPQTAIMLPRPFIETCGPPLRDGYNAIMYDVELRDDRFHAARPEETIDKLRHYLQRPEELRTIARQWGADVAAGHTIAARSRYLLKTMEQRL